LARDAPGQAAAVARPAPGQPLAQKQWYPLGRLALWAAGLYVLLMLGGALTLGPSYETYRMTIEELVQSALRGGLEDLSRIGPNALAADRLARFVASVVLPMWAAASTLLILIILLIAAKLASISARLPRPLPQIAREFVLPRLTLVGMAVSALLAPFPGWSRFLAVAIAATLAMLLAMQGLATAHILVARLPARPIILGVGYAMIVVAFPWMPIGLALLGLAEMALSLRARALAASRGKIN
jgi:hypothetical protein